MNGSWSRVKRSLILLALVGSTFAAFGCNYALNKDFETLYQGIGDAVITQISDTAFGSFGDDFDTVIRGPATAFVQAMWDNYVAARVPNDIELK